MKRKDKGIKREEFQTDNIHVVHHVILHNAIERMTLKVKFFK